MHWCRILGDLGRRQNRKKEGEEKEIIMKKTYGISTELTRLNIKDILANYKNPKYWKNRWTIFKHKDFVCIWRMYCIDLEGNKILSKVQIKYNGKKQHSWFYSFTSYCDSIPIDNPDYSQTVFSRNLLGAVLSSIDCLERDLIEHTYEYKKAQELESLEEKKLRAIASEFLDKEGVKNEDIREAYIEHFVSKAQKFSYTENVKDSSIRKYYPTARLLACSWFDYKKKFDVEKEILKDSHAIKSKLIYKIWKSRKELDGEEYLQEAEDALESIKE